MFVIVFHEAPQSFQRSIPFGRDLFQVLPHFGQPPRLDLPQTVSTNALTLHKSHVLQDLQMLRNSLTRNPGRLLQYDGG